ncbi:MAG: beta-N-acetylhexosaminidase [Clostridia bacterium]|nr:beta-N-acetylhexosaminidase [Clostridia bacterium]
MTNSSIRELAERCLSRSFADVEMIESDSVFVEIRKNKRVVGGANTPQKLRAFSLLSLHDEKKTFSLREIPGFEKLGAMLDMSRGGVMRVGAVKKYINRLALYGANQLLLYTEDTYTLEDYPHFGYLRGAYTDEELKEIDAYAASLDMEVVPCIQTLGHMGQYLSWREETAKIRDTADVLLCDSEDTYRFIEAEIAKMRKVFRSKRIHIGMDEAHDVGLGQYLKKNGFEDRYELMKRHLAKVADICKQYDFMPMMWSDMFFRLDSPTDDYYNYDGNYHFPEEMIENIPDVEMVYWDYYNSTEGAYRNMVRLHKELQKPMIFAGGIWTWNGFLPDHIRTEKTMMPALKVCRENGVGNVIATMWGDNGCETDYFRGLIDFAFFSEYCYSEAEPAKEQIMKMGGTHQWNLC